MVVRSYVGSFVSSFLRPFVGSLVRRTSASVRYTTKACSPGTQPLACCTHRTATNTVLERHDHHPLGSPLPPPVLSPISPARCTAEIISTAVFTEPDSACLMLELRFAEIGKFKDAAAPPPRLRIDTHDFARSEYCRNLWSLCTSPRVSPPIKRLIARIRNYNYTRPQSPSSRSTDFVTRQTISTNL